MLVSPYVLQFQITRKTIEVWDGTEVNQRGKQVCVLKRTFYVIIKVICGRKKKEGHLERYFILFHVMLVNSFG